MAGSRPLRAPATGPRPRRGSVVFFGDRLAEVIGLARVEGRAARRRHEPQPHQRGRRTTGHPGPSAGARGDPSPRRPQHVRQTRPTPRSATAPPPATHPPPGSGTRSAAPSGSPTAARAARTAAGTPSRPASSSAAASTPPSGSVNVTRPSSHETIRWSPMATRNTYGARYRSDRRPSPAGWQCTTQSRRQTDGSTCLQQALVAQQVAELGPEDDRQRLDRHQEVRPRRQPAIAVGAQPAAGDHVVDVGVILQRPAPGVQHAEEPRPIGADVLAGRPSGCAAPRSRPGTAPRRRPADAHRATSRSSAGRVKVTRK